MKRILTVGSTVLLATAMLVGVAFAQPRGFGFGYGMGPGYGMGMMGQPGRGRSMMMDANDDGTVSAEEAASAADEIFTAMDADDDGKLDKAEYIAVRMGPQFGFNSERQAAMQKAKEDRFTAMDADAEDPGGGAGQRHADQQHVEQGVRARCHRLQQRMLAGWKGGDAPPDAKHEAPADERENQHSYCDMHIRRGGVRQGAVHPTRPQPHDFIVRDDLKQHEQHYDPVQGNLRFGVSRGRHRGMLQWSGGFRDS